MSTKSLFKKKGNEKKKKSSSKEIDPNAHIKLAKETALRDKVEEAQRAAAIEKVKMLNEKDKYEMLIGRKELATRYHKYLNKQLKERRILYVMINVDGTHAGPDVGSEWQEPSPTEPVTTKIRVKIKSGQDADFIAANLIDRYGLAVVHLNTIRETINEAIAKHEADNKLYEAEVAKVGMLIASNEGDDSDGDDDDDDKVVTDEYLLMKKRLVKARRLAKEYEKQRQKIETDLAQHHAAPKIAYDGGEPSESLVKELLFERDRYSSIKHQLITSRDRVMSTQKERRQLDGYKQKLLAKITEANKAASGEISVAAFWADYSHNSSNNEKILLGNSDDESDESDEVSDEEQYHGNSNKPAPVKAAEVALSNGMKGMSNFLKKSATSFRDTIGDEKEVFDSLSQQMGASEEQLTSGIDGVFGGVSDLFQERKQDKGVEEEFKNEKDNQGQHQEEEEGMDGVDSVTSSHNKQKNNDDNHHRKSQSSDQEEEESSASLGLTNDKPGHLKQNTPKTSISVDQLPEHHRPSMFESMFAVLGGPGSASKFGPQNVLLEEFSDLPSPNQMAGFLEGIETPHSY